VIRGVRGGPLGPLAAQLNHDAAHLQGQRLELMFGQLAQGVRDVLGRMDAMPPAPALAHLPAAVPVVAGDIPQQPPGFVPRAQLLAELDAAGAGVRAVTGMRRVGKPSWPRRARGPS